MMKWKADVAIVMSDKIQFKMKSINKQNEPLEHYWIYIVPNIGLKVKTDRIGRKTDESPVMWEILAYLC